MRMQNFRLLIHTVSENELYDGQTDKSEILKKKNILKREGKLFFLNKLYNLINKLNF